MQAPIPLRHILKALALAGALTASFAAMPRPARAASMEIWPSERRGNNTLFCYGGDWNSMLIAIYPEDYGKQRVQLPEQFTEPTVLAVTLPAAVQFLGADVMGIPGVGKEFPSQEVARDGKSYRQVRITLPNETLGQRLLKGKYYYHVFVWYAAPENLDDRVSYELLYGGRPLAAGSSRLQTAGVVTANRAMPKRFGFCPYGIHTRVPNGDHDRMAEFLRRFGVSGIEAHWPYGLPAEQPTEYHRTFEANRRHGVKNIANMTLFGNKYGGAYGGVQEAVMKRGGLAPAMDESCAGLESAPALADWRAAHAFFDMALFDWEPTGQHLWPGYEDKATVAAFAAAQGLAEAPAPEVLQAKYREAYARFRMEQIARPLYAMRKTIDAVKPIPLRVEQGSGASSHVEYDVYGRDFPALSPMIYQPTPIGYARNLLEMLASTRVPAAKFWPDLTIGWPVASVHRQSPQEFLMDTVVTAAAGCGSVSHWPGMPHCDAAWFGIHEGLARIARVEAFYLDGKRVDDIAMAGVPYREEKISLGNRTLDHSAPDWRAALIPFAHEHAGEHLLTLLNYHLTEDCFVRVGAPALRGRYLVNPVEQVYQVLDGAGKALVRVGKESPGMWIATTDKKRLAGCRRIEGAAVEREFAAARGAFLAASGKSEIQLGTVQQITVAYGMTRFGGEERVTLQVKTPTQTVAFGPSGGRVYDWAVKGMGPFVARDSLGTDGLAMDMLWLPASARWCGDETQELSLVECRNDGRNARIVYEGKLKKGFPGLRLLKTYSVPATGTSLSVEVALHNERVDQTPVSVSYWGHNVLKAEAAHFVGRQLAHETGRGVTTVVVAEGLPEELKREVVMPDRIIGATGPVFAEFLPESKSGLIFRLPDNFMSVYRWNHYGKAMCGSEWMSQPLSIPAGTSAALRFSITAVPEATPDSLRAALSADALAPAGDANLLPFAFAKRNAEGLPADWRVQAGGANAAAAQVTAAADPAGDAVVSLAMPKEASVFLDTAAPVRLDPDGDYMLVVQMKVDEMHFTGNWYERPAGVRVYVYGTDNKHTWLAIHGEGSTKGWVTAVLPFPPPGQRQQFANANVYLRCYNMMGTVSFRNPILLRQPAGGGIQRHFVLEDGTQVTNSHLQLRR